MNYDLWLSSLIASQSTDIKKQLSIKGRKSQSISNDLYSHNTYPYVPTSYMIINPTAATPIILFAPNSNGTGTRN